MDKNNHVNRYDDIIHLPHPTSAKHPRMSISDRAAQFSPFAALTGHEAAITETARLTEQKVELDASEKAVLDAKLRMLAERLPENPVVTVTYFVPDKTKQGGAYFSKTGVVRRMDVYAHRMEFIDRESVAIEDLIEISGDFFCETI